MAKKRRRYESVGLWVDLDGWCIVQVNQRKTQDCHKFETWHDAFAKFDLQHESVHVVDTQRFMRTGRYHLA